MKEEERIYFNIYQPFLGDDHPCHPVGGKAQYYASLKLESAVQMKASEAVFRYDNLSAHCPQHDAKVIYYLMCQNNHFFKEKNLKFPLVTFFWSNGEQISSFRLTVLKFFLKKANSWVNTPL